ncbi:MAG: hypothetical protein JSV33_02030 [bacterium]|nr:MAG: hypothetical protein JSV33_02030 [bacterium]
MKKITSILVFSVILYTSALVSGQSAAQYSSIIERVDHFIACLPDEFNGTILLAADDTILQYEGVYCSVELQKIYRFDVVEDHLVAFNFLEGNNVPFIPVGTDLFSWDKGFLVFHRYEDHTIRDFWLMSENVDHIYGITVHIKVDAPDVVWMKKEQMHGIL